MAEKNVNINLIHANFMLMLYSIWFLNKYVFTLTIPPDGNLFGNPNKECRIGNHVSVLISFLNEFHVK